MDSRRKDAKAKRTRMSGTAGSFRVSTESTPPIVSLEKETALMRGRDAPAAERRRTQQADIERLKGRMG
jgi:hypothetical protein